jgi:hypothetical protein
MANETTTTPDEEQSFLDWIKGGISSMFNGVADNVTGALNNAGTGLQTALESLKADFAGLLDTLNPMNYLRAGASALMTPVVDFLRGIVEYIQGTLKWATGNDSTFGNEFLRQLEDLIPRPANDETAPRTDLPAPAP